MHHEELKSAILENSDLRFCESEINKDDYIRIELGMPTHTLILDRIPIRFEEPLTLVGNSHGSDIINAFHRIKGIAESMTFNQDMLQSDIYFEITINQNQI